MCIYCSMLWCSTALSYKLPRKEGLLMLLLIPESFAQIVSVFYGLEPRDSEPFSMILIIVIPVVYSYISH